MIRLRTRLRKKQIQRDDGLKGFRLDVRRNPCSIIGKSRFMKICFNISSDIRTLCFSDDALRQLGKLGELDAETPAKLTKDWLLSKARDCNALVTGWGSVRLDDEVLDAMPNLQLILHSAGSIRSIESQHLWERGIRVTSAANVNGVPVAEFLLGLILTTFKGVFAYSGRFQSLGRSGWRRDLHVPGYYNSTVGIIGMGNVGKYLLNLLSAFHFRVLVHSFYPFEEQAEAAGVELVEIDEIMRESDAVVLAAPNIEPYHNMINAGRLALMKDGAWLLNAARGALVNESALIAELQSGRINAALDVTHPEPPIEGSPFYSLPNCILTPHIAGSIQTECLRLGDQVVKELSHYLSGQPFENEITEELASLIG